MIPLQVETDKVRAALTQEYGVIYYPKRALVLPAPDPKIIYTLTIEGEQDPVTRTLVRFGEYVNGQAIGDRFGTDHQARISWLDQMNKKFGEAFHYAYYEPNQFRVNRMLKLAWGLEYLEGVIVDDQTKQRIIQLGVDVGIVIEGYEDPRTQEVVFQSYRELETDQKRLHVVHFLENRCIDTLRLFS